MKILYLCPDTGIDVLGHKGASIHVREMIAAFARAGHTVDLVAPRLTRVGATPATVDASVERVRVPDAVQDVKVTLDDWTTRFDTGGSLPKDVRRMLYDRHLVEHLASTRTADPPDMIYVRASLLSTAGVTLASETGRPLVVELNAPLADEQTRYRAGALDTMYAAAEQHLLRAATTVIVVSEALAEHVRRVGVEARKVLVLPNAIDPRRFKPASPRPPTDPVLGFVGGLRAWHGADLLPEILQRVRSRHPAATLVVAGDGPERQAIERRAHELGVTDAIRMLGAVDHDSIPDVIGGWSIALAPYPVLAHDFYFSPLKLFEYLGCGLPVVASAVGQTSELIRDREHARLVTPGAVSAIADVCCELLDDPAGAAAMARRGSEYVHAHHTWDRNAAAVERAVFAAAR